MSSYFNLIGRLRDNRALIKDIVARLGRLERQVNRIETIDFRHFLRSNNDRIIYVGTSNTDLGSLNIDPNLKEYQMPIEPDGEFLTTWLKFLFFDSNSVTDSSGFNNTALIEGNPTGNVSPISGLPAMLFDGNLDRLRIPNSGTTNTFGTTIGFSISFNVNPIAISLHGGKPRILCAKTDDTIDTQQQGWMIWVEPTGTVYFAVRIANVTYTASKTNAFPALNAWYKMAFTFDRVAFIPKIYVNGVASGEAVTSYVGAAELPSVSTDLSIGGDDVPARGRFAGFFSDWRYWREKILTQTEISNWQLNSYSISSIVNVARAGVGQFPSTEGFGGVPPTQPPPAETVKSFSPTSFTTASFTVNV